MEILGPLGLALSDMGRLPGLVIVGGGSLLGAIKAIQISRRETTHTLCALSLACSLGAFAGTSLVRYLAQATDWGPTLRLIQMPIAGLLFASPILAILGLVNYRRKRDQYVQGRAQATWTLVLFAAFVLLTVYGVVRASRRARERQPSPSSVPTVHEFNSEPFGVSLHFPGTSWWHEPQVRVHFPGALLGAVQRAGTCVVIVPYQIPLSVSDTNGATLLAAARALVCDQFALSTAPRAKRLDDAIGTSHQLTFNQTVAGQRFEYMSRIVRRADLVFVVHTWCTDGSDSSQHRLDGVFRGLRIARTSEPPLRDDWPEGSGVACAAMAAQLAGVAYDEGRIADAAEYSRSAVQYDPKPEEYLLSAFNCLNQLERYDDASRLYWEFAPLTERSLELRSWGPYFDLQCGSTEKAFGAYAQLFTDGHRDEEDLKLYVQALNEAERYDEATKTLRRFDERQASTRVRRWLGQTRAMAGDHEEAIVLFHDLRREHPSDAALAFELVRILYGADRFTEALAEAEKALGAGLGTAGLHEFQGLSALALDRHHEAKAAFEAGLALDASHEELQELLRQASARLGEGENSSVKHPLPAVEVPAALQRLAEKATAEPPPDPAGHALWYRSRISALEFRSEQVHRKTTYLDYVVVDPKTAPGAGSLSFSFNGVSERIYVNTLEVRDAEGTITARGDPSAYYVQRDESSTGATERRRLVVPVPGIHPGARVQIAVTVEARSPDATLPLERVSFAKPYPCVFQAFAVHGDVASLVHREGGPLVSGRADDTLYWYLENAPATRTEPAQVHESEYVPYLWLADEASTWDGVAQSYLTRIGDRLPPTQGTIDRARQVTQSAAGRMEKIAALARYVQDTLAYKAIAFGHRAMVPEPVPTTLERGWGDCKDHALLLHQLLRAVGIESHLALIQAGSPERIEFPSIQYFNHMVVHVPGEDLFLDATDKDSAVLAPVPWWLEDRTTLVLDAKQPRLARTPPYAPEHNSIEVSRRIELGERKGEDEAILTRVSETVRMRGFYAGWWRSALRRQAEEERVATILSALDSSGRIRMEACTFQGMNAPEQPLILELAYTVLAAFRAPDGAIVGGAPAPWAHWLLRTTPVDTRRSPFELRIDRTFTSETDVAAPEGYRTTAPQAGTREGESPFGAWKCAWSMQDASVRVTYRHEAKSGRHAPETYAEYVLSRREALKPLGRTILMAAE